MLQFRETLEYHETTPPSPLWRNSSPGSKESSPRSPDNLTCAFDLYSWWFCTWKTDLNLAAYWLWMYLTSLKLSFLYPENKPLQDACEWQWNHVCSSPGLVVFCTHPFVLPLSCIFLWRATGTSVNHILSINHHTPSLLWTQMDGDTLWGCCLGICLKC